MSLYRTRWDVSGEIVIEPRKEWYSIKEAVAILNLGRMTVQRHIYSGELKAWRIGGSARKAGRWRIPYKALQDFIRTLERR